MSRECSNCPAIVPEGQGGIGPHGNFVCCEHCMFNPNGCRCQYGEYGEAFDDRMLYEVLPDDGDEGL